MEKEFGYDPTINNKEVGEENQGDNEKLDFDAVSYIKEHIESDLSYQPEIGAALAKALLALLYSSEDWSGDDYLLIPVTLLHQIELNPELTALTGHGRLMLHESKKAAMLFEKLNAEQRKEIEEFLVKMF